MFIPVLGVFAGMAMLGEVPHWQDYAAILLILGAMSTVLFQSKSKSS
jgi:drug/metabolite transporter (DMT)-like permease